MTTTTPNEMNAFPNIRTVGRSGTDRIGGWPISCPCSRAMICAKVSPQVAAGVGDAHAASPHLVRQVSA